MLKRLYARIVLRLIRPALELSKPNTPEFNPQHVIDVIVNDARKNGPIRRAVKGGL